MPYLLQYTQIHMHAQSIEWEKNDYYYYLIFDILAEVHALYSRGHICIHVED